MNLTPIFERYERLAAGADQAFERMQREHGDQVRCKPHCTDCCYALFGLFMVEALYLRRHFEDLDRKQRRVALRLGDKAEQELKRLEAAGGGHDATSEMDTLSLARQRIRCPLLNDHQECILYAYRPITCRVYGIPTLIQGQARVCGKSGFKKGGTYPAFDLDRVYKELFSLSSEILQGTGRKDLHRASLLLSVSKALRTSVEDLISGGPGGPQRVP